VRGTSLAQRVLDGDLRRIVPLLQLGGLGDPDRERGPQAFEQDAPLRRARGEDQCKRRSDGG
jgi:hypothetical protein